MIPTITRARAPQEAFYASSLYRTHPQITYKLFWHHYVPRIEIVAEVFRQIGFEVEVTTSFQIRVTDGMGDRAVVSVVWNHRYDTEALEFYGMNAEHKSFLIQADNYKHVARSVAASLLRIK